MLVPGLLSIAFGQLWLFPSLGPTAFLQAGLPQMPTSRFSNVVAGHLIGAVVAIVLVLLIIPEDEPSTFELKALTARRLAASVTAVAVTLLIAVPVRVGLCTRRRRRPRCCSPSGPSRRRGPGWGPSRSVSWSWPSSPRGCGGPGWPSPGNNSRLLAVPKASGRRPHRAPLGLGAPPQARAAWATGRNRLGRAVAAPLASSVTATSRHPRSTPGCCQRRSTVPCSGPPHQRSFAGSQPALGGSFG
jgi:hypothetical protein